MKREERQAKEIRTTLNEVSDKVADIIQGNVGNLRYNVANVLHSIFCNPCRDGEIHQAVHKVVNTVFDTTTTCGPEDESYPCFDRDNKDFVKAMKILQNIVKEKL